MNAIAHYSLYILLIICLAVIQPVYADNLGRLFTTPGERSKLEKIKHEKAKPEKIDVAKIDEIMEEPVKEEKEVVVHDAIILKGIVYRGDGKNSAWFNDSNTFEGDLESQDLQVDNNEITQDQVQITMPDQTTKIKLKVGDYYDPQKKEAP